MAIIIPSKNIYKISENQTILDNIIGQVSAEQTEISTISQSLDTTSISIFTEQQARVFFGIDTYLKLAKNPYIEVGSKIKDNAKITAVGTSTFQYFEITIVVSTQNYLDLKNIHAKLNYTYRYGNHHASTSGYGFDGNGLIDIAKGSFVFDIGYVTNPAYILPRIGSVPDVPLEVTMTPSTSGDTGISKVEISLAIPYYFWDTSQNTPNTFAMESVDIEIYGNVYASENIKKNYGSGKIYTLPSNELTQTGTTIGGVPQFEYMAKKITSDYAQGKETMVLRCPISDYYHENGIKEISITGSKMSFEHYDEVLPMLFGADGKDSPMSVKKDGSPKTFRVLGTRKIYDGAVWQELYLQEI